MDNSNNSNTSRIAKNTIMLYGRMLFSMLVSLYTSRVILAALGVEDYGIYDVVGGLVSMFAMISNSLSAAVSRFLTFELGKGNTVGLQKVFSTALYIHLCLAGIIILLAESLGIWFLNSQMNIPENRIYAANWVFQASLISFVFGVTSVPFNASIISHEKMGVFAFIGIFDVIMKLLIVLFVAYSGLSFDRLIVYSLLLVGVSLTIQITYIIYCKRTFKECIFRPEFDKKYWKEVCSFAGWNFIGCTAGLLKDQGVNILLNIFIGPVANAARGIANTVNSALSSFARNFMTAINPQITKSYASGEFDYMNNLVERGSRFSFYIIMILTYPILFETEFILKLWLYNYPVYSVHFVQLSLILSMIGVLSNTLITLQLATGVIRNYQLAVGGVLLANFPLSYTALKHGIPAECVYIIAIIVEIFCMFLRLIFLKKMINFNPTLYLKNVCWNILKVSSVSIIPPAIVYHIMEDSCTRFIIICITCIVICSASIYLIGCSPTERNFIILKVRQTIQSRHNHD